MRGPAIDRTSVRSRARIAIVAIVAALASAVISCEIEVPLVESTLDAGGSGDGGGLFDDGAGSGSVGSDSGWGSAGSDGGLGSGSGLEPDGGFGSGSGADAAI
jgi:hypothetical protein